MARARSLTEFQETFPDEASCAAFLFDRRWPDGFICPVCGNGRAAALKSRAYTYECSDCARQTSITAGTALHRTKLPLTVWFWAAHLMSTHSNGMSARQCSGARHGVERQRPDRARTARTPPEPRARTRLRTRCLS